jgi:hypothetical protein
LHFRILRGKSREAANPSHPVTQLRPRRDRPPRRSAAEQRDELASMELIEWHPTQ